MPQFANAQDLVAIEEIRDGTVLGKNGSLHQILIVGGINFALKSEAEQSVMTAAYQNFLNSLSFPIQIIVHSRKINIQKYLTELEERKKGEPSPLLQDQIGEYKEFISKFVSENEIMAKTFFVVVPFVPIELPSRESVSRFIPFLGKKTDKEALRKEQDTDFNAHAAQLRQRVTQVVDGLSAIGLEGIPLTTRELIELFYNFYNPEATEKEAVMNPAQ